MRIIIIQMRMFESYSQVLGIVFLSKANKMNFYTLAQDISILVRSLQRTEKGNSFPITYVYMFLISFTRRVDIAMSGSTKNSLVGLKAIVMNLSQKPSFYCRQDRASHHGSPQVFLIISLLLWAIALFRLQNCKFNCIKIGRLFSCHSVYRDYTVPVRYGCF